VEEDWIVVEIGWGSKRLGNLGWLATGIPAAATTQVDWRPRLGTRL